jgi:hypothetical protein
VRIDDDVWAAVKGMDVSLNQFLRMALIPGSENEALVKKSEEDGWSEEKFTDERPPNRDCKHGPHRFYSGNKFATICPGCKSTGHTGDPRECPRCTEGAGI